MSPQQAAFTLPRVESRSYWSSDDDHPGTFQETQGRYLDMDLSTGGSTSIEASPRPGHPQANDTMTLNLLEATLSSKLPIITPRIIPSTSESFKVLRKWEGKVLSVGADSFVARLADLSGEESAEEAEFPVDEISDEDLKLMGVGAVFYWSIGVRVTRGGQRLNQSMIRFRRLPAWSRRELAAARERAKRVADEIGWYSDV